MLIFLIVLPSQRIYLVIRKYQSIVEYALFVKGNFVYHAFASRNNLID